MTETATTLKPGNIYRWSYRDYGPNDHGYGVYHCCSRIAIVDGAGRLRDTYWHSGSDGRLFNQSDLPRLDLTFLGNMADLDRADEHMGAYYDDEDIVNLNHANSTRGNFYLRKGAKRSQKKLLASAKNKLDEAIGDEKSAAHRVAHLKLAISQIEAGELGVYI